MMKKKIISLSLAALLLMLTIVPSAVYAENSNGKQGRNASEEASTEKESSAAQKESEAVTQEESAPVTQAQGKTIYVDGKTTGVGSDNNTGETKDDPVETLKKAVELAGENGEVIVLNTVFIREDTVLDNNVTVKRGGTCDVGMIYLGESKLTINHATIDGNMEEYPTSAQLIAIYNSPELIINDGAKLCNQGGYVVAQMGTSGNGPVVRITGGEICDNDASNTYYKSVFYYAQLVGSLYVSGGSIHDNKGGALDIGVPTFEMTGGKIYNNNNPGREFGGIYYRGGNSGVISGGEIYNNTTSRGGGIHVAGQATLTLKGDAVVRNNTATYGGGVYVDYGKFVMESGTITGNTGTNYGGAICLYNELESKTNDALRARVHISGGTIEGNTDGNATSGIDYVERRDDKTGEWAGPPILQLSGNPTIKDYIYLNDYQDMTAKVEVIDTFEPTQPVPIYDYKWTDNRVIVSYKEGLTARKADFVKHNKKKTQDILVDGQDLKSINIQLQNYDVVFKEEDGSVTYKTISIEQDEKIPAAQIPDVKKEGYVLAGWKTAAGNWDFDNDLVTGNMELYPVWKLEVPAFNLSTDKDHLHEEDEQNATLVAQISITDGSILTYNWKWYKDGEVVKEGKDENVLNVTEAGVYKAELTVTNGTDTSDPISKEITITKTNHASSGAWQYNSRDHWKICDECDKNIQQAAHTFGDWTDVSRAKRERVCTVCGYKVTEDTPDTKKYSVNYEFVSGTSGKSLPAAVTVLLPDDNTKYEAGTKVTAKMPTQTTVEVSGGTWTFVGYDADENVIIGDVIFTGTWTFEKKAKEYGISYEFISGTKGKELPKEVLALLPEDTAKYEEGTRITAEMPTQTEVKMQNGRWVFNSYDAETKTVSANTVFTGVWNFVEDGGSNNPPVIVVKDITIALGSSFDAKTLARAVDDEDGDITDRIEVIKDTVDMSKEGSYEVTYQVTDSQGATTLSTITVNVARALDPVPVNPGNNNQNQTKADQMSPSKPDAGANDQSNSIKSTVISESAKSAKTGDQSPVVLYELIAGICAVGILVLVRRKRSR